MAHAPFKSHPHPAKMGGTQDLYRFANGYGASVIQFPGSYGYKQGQYELAVVAYDDPDANSFVIVYDTPITNDVIGYLSPAEVQFKLDQISALPARATA